MTDWPDAILFDFDGVLVHSEPLHYLALSQAAGEDHLKVTEEQYYHDLLGFDDRGAFKQVYALNERTPEPGAILRLCARKKQIAQELIHHKQYNALPGVEELVRGLWRMYPLAICSGAMSDEIELMLEGINLRDCFRVIVSAEDVNIGKPDPECYLRGVEMLSSRYHRPIDIKKCMVIEDAPRVIDRLKPHGFVTVGVASHTPADRFDHADYIIQSLEPAEVLKKINRLKLYSEPADVIDTLTSASPR